jgi:signal transduction histidine kinase
VLLRRGDDDGLSSAGYRGSVTHGRIRERWARVPPPLRDAGLAAAVAIAVSIAIAAGQEIDAKDPGALAYLLGVAIAAPLLVRRRFPLAVLLASAGLVIAYHVLEYPAIGLAVPLAASLYAAAEAGYVRAAVIIIAALELFAVVWRVFGEDESLVSAVGTQTLFEASLAAAVLLLAETVRSRRAWMTEVQARLERAEVEREREAGRRVQQERIRIAREMHDVLAHTIAVIGVQAGVAAEALADSPEAASAALRTIREKSREAMAEIRGSVGVLREAREDAPTSPAPGLSQLDELVDVAADAEVQVEVSVSGAKRPLPPVVDLTAYRIVQEALTNVLRHAGATLAQVGIRYEPDALVVEVEDDGAKTLNGAHAAEDGYGLTGMRERAAAIGGRLEAGVAPGAGGGFRVRAWLPTERRDT